MRFAAVITVAVLTLVGTAALPPSAHGAYAGERPANNPTVDQMVGVGESYWHARGVQPCPNPQVYFADNLDEPRTTGVEARAQQPGCLMWVLVDLITYAQSHPKEKWWSGYVCTIVLHELGHTAGLGHSSDPLSPMFSTVTTEVPWECRVWARDRARAARSRH